MKLIVGLGNPGKDYEKTRHNAGFLFVDFIATKKDLTFKENFNALLADFIDSNGEKVLLAKPLTFMNNSGLAIQKIADFYKIYPEDIYIAFDDLDLTFGTYKMQVKKYPKVHNGVNSAIQHLASDNLNFIRIGVDDRTPELRKVIVGSNYVLERFPELPLSTFEEIYQALLAKKLI